MKTISFIGSDKNAGKTTVMNYLISQVPVSNPLCITSIGINGEKTDQYEFHQKPSITIKAGHYFVTNQEHLKDVAGCYDIIHIFPTPQFKKNFVLGKCLTHLALLLEGPNEGEEILRMKNILKNKLKINHLFIDGSIDRQFIGHPDISDCFYFSLLLSSRKEQIQKAKDLLAPLHFEECPKKIKDLIEKDKSFKSVLIDVESKPLIIYQSLEMAFTDEKLHKLCLQNSKKKMFLYLKSSLSRTLFELLSGLQHLTIVLDNFTLYQNINVHLSGNRASLSFRPSIQLLYPIKVEKIFLREEGLANINLALSELGIPQNLPLLNLYKEDHYAIRI